MPKDILHAHELGAMLEAGVIAGGYLDESGRPISPTWIPSNGGNSCAGC